MDGIGRSPGRGDGVSNEKVETYGGQEFVVRRVTGSAATKAYRCPGCQQQIRPATPHTVAWPVTASMFSDSGLAERRHWHNACWSARDRRG